MKEMLTNKILTGLPQPEFDQLLPLLEPVSLNSGERLMEAGETPRFVYFPENAVCAYMAETIDGKSAEISLIGREGTTGVQTFLDTSVSPQSLDVAVAGSALRMWKTDFESATKQSDGLRNTMLAFAGNYMIQVSQRSACAVLHSMEQRFAIWLLMLADRIEGNQIEITQERIAHHLGVRRAGITVAAGELQKRGAISYTRGNLRIVNRDVLLGIACECYDTLASTVRIKAFK
jgi:CRP-like cAMP-binding protein